MTRSSSIYASLVALLGTVLAGPSLLNRQIDAATTSTGSVTLVPATAPVVDTFKPAVNVSLPYGTDSQNVNVNLTTSHSSILLESLPSLVSVDCGTDSVSMVFDSAVNLVTALSEWSAFSKLLLITNHMGDCDSELERGFFVAESFADDEASLTLVASTQKSSINGVSSILTTDFSGIPAAAAAASKSKSKRALGEVTFSPDPINFSTDLVLNTTTLFSDADFSATVDSGDLDLSVTVGGTLTYNVLKSELVSLTLFLESNITTDIVLDLAIDVPSNKTFSYDEALEFYAVDIPGVLTFGPAITFSIGADVATDAGIDVVLDLASSVNNGSIVLDYTGNLTASGSWEPTIDVTVTLSEAAGVAITPFITTNITLSFELLGGALNVSGGIAPQSSFPTVLTVGAEQVIGAGKNQTATATPIGAAGCDQGVAVSSIFDFSVDAFVAGKWNDEYAFNTSKSVLNECFTW